MRARLEGVSLFLLILCLSGVSVVYGQNKFKLKPGAQGKLCLNCHNEFEEKLKSKFVHSPVKTGECSGCHNPHTSAHGKLLDASAGTICVKCHAGIIPDKVISAHKVAVEGNCVKCHDPHASNNKANLLKAGNELCVGCHKTIGDTIAKIKFKHSPVEGGCLNCHNPHASEKSAHLLKSPVPGLCVECHKPDSPRFVSQHVNYPVATANCASCHNPHGSNTAGILFDTVHSPVANKRCSQCHEAATSPAPFKTRRPGFELCRGCHSAMMNEAFGKNRIHWPLVDEVGCLNCHEAHASTQKKLLKAEEASLCARCHQDTMEWQAKLAAKEKQERAALRGRPEKGAFTHSPVQQGNCTVCHSPHASDSVFLARQASTVEGCGTCHDWLKHSSHPMGEKFADPRNKNTKVDCLSCHRSHGTGYRYIIPFPASTDLCVQCHAQLKR
jgi:predicted CXXCH cytochrome family protein